MLKMEPAMNRELVTDPLDHEDLWSDLRANIELLTARGHSRVLAFFGFAWGRHIYPHQWYDMPMSLMALEKKINERKKVLDNYKSQKSTLDKELELIERERTDIGKIIDAFPIKRPVTLLRGGIEVQYFPRCKKETGVD